MINKKDYYDSCCKIRMTKQVCSMISVIICDDDQQFAYSLKRDVESILREKQYQAKMFVCTCAADIGNELLESCDVAFLDIDFTGENYNGIDIAQLIRQKRNDATIVFVTNYIEYAPVGYEVQAFRYLLKDDISSKLFPCIEQILAHIREVKSTIKIPVDGEIMEFRVSEISFIEAFNHTLIIHVCVDSASEKKYCCYSTLSKMEMELEDRGFLRLHKSFLVNMAHIKKLTYDNVTLKDGTTLRVSNKMYSDIKKKYMLWKGTY